MFLYSWCAHQFCPSKYSQAVGRNICETRARPCSIKTLWFCKRGWENFVEHVFFLHQTSSELISALRSCFETVLESPDAHRVLFTFRLCCSWDTQVLLLRWAQKCLSKSFVLFEVSVAYTVKTQKGRVRNLDSYFHGFHVHEAQTPQSLYDFSSAIFMAAGKCNPHCIPIGTIQSQGDRII